MKRFVFDVFTVLVLLTLQIILNNKDRAFSTPLPPSTLKLHEAFSPAPIRGDPFANPPIAARSLRRLANHRRMLQYFCSTNEL